MDLWIVATRTQTLTYPNVMKSHNTPPSAISLLWVRFAGTHETTHSECLIAVCGRRLTDTRFSVIAALLAHLFGVDRPMVRLSVTLVDCTRRHEIHLDQPI